VYLLSVVSSGFITPDGLVVGAFYAEPDVTFQVVRRVFILSVRMENITICVSKTSQYVFLFR